MIPLYTVLMALPAKEADLQSLYKEKLSFVWTRTVDSEISLKRKQVARKRLSASFSSGGLQIQHPDETADGLQINIIQKYLWKMEQGTYTKFT
jgi:hypothetical protein